MDRNQVESIARQILAEMGGDAEKICSGDCPVFAKKLIDRVGKGKIVSNLANAMVDEIAGYEVAGTDFLPNPNRNPEASHCWVNIDGVNYDAFDPQGCSNERDLEFVQKFA